MKTVQRICLGLAVCVVATLAPKFVSAEVTAPTYQMTVIEDAAYGRNIVSGKYDVAIDRLSVQKKRYTRSFAAQNNLCVASTKSGDLAMAEAACDSAIALVKNSRLYDESARFVPGHQKAKLKKDLAIALSNRGVLHVILGDSVSATADFREAEKLETGLDAPLINLARVAL